MTERDQPLNRATIVDACIDLIERDGVAALTVRRLGDALGVDATAFYRHFADKGDLLRAVGDRIHGAVVVGLPGDDAEWKAVVREVCVRLRQAHLARPDLAELIRTGPPLQDNEFELTEVLLRQLRRSGLNPEAIAMAYHALIELTIGSAAIDAPVAALPEADRAHRYDSWRRAYATLDHGRFPESVQAATHMYRQTSHHRFEFALDLMLNGIAP